MQKRLIYITSFSLFFLINYFSQKNNKLDSLFKVINTTKNDSIKIYTYCEISDVCLNNKKYALALKNLDTALVLANATKKTTLINTMLNYIGLYYNNLKNYSKSMEYYNLLYKSWYKLGNKKKVGRTLYNIGNIYYQTNNLKKAEAYYRKSLLFAKTVNDTNIISDLYNNIGIIYAIQDNNSMSKIFLKKAFDISVILDNKLGQAYYYNNLGKVAIADSEYILAINCYNKALQIKLKIGDKNNISDAYKNLGSGYVYIKNYKKAIECLNLAYKNCDTNNYNENLSAIYNNYANSYEKLNDYKNANKYNKLLLVVKDSLNKVQTSNDLENSIVLSDLKQSHINDSIINITKIQSQNLKLKRGETIKYSLIIIVIIIALFLIIIFNRFKISQAQKKEISLQKDLVDEKQKEIISSINYAKRIQQSMLPSEKYISKKIIRKKSFDSAQDDH